MLRGRCRACKEKFSVRYALVEVLTGILAMALYYVVMSSTAFVDESYSLRMVRFLVYGAFLFVLVVITFIDLDHMLILDKVTYPSIPIFYGLGLLLPEREIWDGVIGAVVGYGIVRVISDGYYHLFGREGMGYGDGKLLAIIGAFLGWRAVFVSLTVGCIVGVAVSIPLLLLSRRIANKQSDETGQAVRYTQIPFGPYLAVGALLYVVLSPWLRISFAF